MTGTRSRMGLAMLVARREYLRVVRRRGFLLATLFVPLTFVVVGAIATLVSGGSFGQPPGTGDDNGARIRLVNESALPLAADPAFPGIELTSRDAATAELRSGVRDEFYVVPSGYPERATIERVSGDAEGIDLSTAERHGDEEGALEDYLRSGLVRSQGLPAAVAERIAEPVEVRQTTLEGTTAPPRDVVATIASFAFPYVLAILFVFSLFTTSGYLLQSVTEEKENRVIEIVLSSVPAIALMAGKVVGLGAAGLTQVLIWLVSGLVVLGFLGLLPLLSVGVPVIAAAAAYFVLGYLAYGALFAAVGAVAPGTREAQQYSSIFAVFATIPFMLAGLFIADPESPVVTALVVFPLTAPVAALELLALRAADPPWPLMAISLAVLAAFTAVAVVLSARVFRATVLLYGAQPSIRGVVRAMLARG